MEAGTGSEAGGSPGAPAPVVRLRTVAAQWLRIGCLGFGGPPAHITMLRSLVVDRRQWIPAADFEHAVAAANLLPGPASTQLAIWCGWRVRRSAGALTAGLCFIVPGLVVVLALASLVLSAHAPGWVYGAAAGAGAAVPAVAVRAAADLAAPSWRQIGTERVERGRWGLWVVAGAAAGALAGEFVVLVLLGCGLAEVVVHLARRPPPVLGTLVIPALLPAVLTGAAGFGALVWVAVKVGALSYGGGFVIVPLMQADAVHHYHWMTGQQFLDAVTLGQITPGPVVQTVAVVGYAAGGLGGGLAAAAVAFSPSFVFVLAGAPHFDQLRRSVTARRFLRGAGPAAIGAIAGAAVPLGLALTHVWQVGVLAGAATALVVLRRPVVVVLVASGALGVVLYLAGVAVGR